MESSFLSFLSWQQVFEVLALLTGFLCVSLQILEKISAWLFGIISVVLLACIFFHTRLFSDFLLHIIFLILNIYGWWHWSRKGDSSAEAPPVLRLRSHEWKFYLLLVAILFPVWGWLMQILFKADVAYLDAFTTVGSLVAQFLLAKKYLENWIFWIVVDVVAIVPLVVVACLL